MSSIQSRTLYQSLIWNAPVVRLERMRHVPEIAGYFFANQTQKSKQEVSEEEKETEKNIDQDQSKFMFNSFKYNIKQA